MEGCKVQQVWSRPQISDILQIGSFKILFRKEASAAHHWWSIIDLDDVCPHIHKAGA